MKSELNKYDNINADDAQFISDIKAIVYTAKQKAYQAADALLNKSNMDRKGLNTGSTLLNLHPRL